MGKFSKKRFSKVNIEISNICNLQCSFCPEVLRAKKTMDIDLFERVIQQVSPLTDQVCLHLMGEPLLHPKLAEMVEICSKYNTRIFLVSNGVLLREKHQYILKDPIFRQICFSLHSYPDNFGQRDPSVYLQRIFEFTDMVLQERPELYINFRLWNLQDVRGGSSSNIGMLQKISQHYEQPLDVEHFDVRRGKSIRITGRLYLHFDTEFTWPSLDIPILQERGTCYGLRSHFGILADGTVVPCCLDKEGVIPLGNIAEQNILDVLEGTRAQKILKGFREGRLEEDLCKRCNYIERFEKKGKKQVS